MARIRKYKGGQFGVTLRKRGSISNIDKWRDYKHQMDIYAAKNPDGFNQWLEDQLEDISNNEEYYKESKPYEYKYVQLVTFPNNSSSVGRRSVGIYNNSSTIANNNAYSVGSTNSDISTYEVFDLNDIETVPFNSTLIEKIKDVKERYPDTYEGWKENMRRSFGNAMVRDGPQGAAEWKATHPNTVRWFDSQGLSSKLFRGGRRIRRASKRKTMKKRKY
jgi:hypothetical protein